MHWALLSHRTFNVSWPCPSVPYPLAWPCPSVPCPLAWPCPSVPYPLAWPCPSIPSGLALSFSSMAPSGPCLHLCPGLSFSGLPSVLACGMECSGQEEEFAEANQMEVTWEDREKKKRHAFRRELRKCRQAAAVF